MVFALGLHIFIVRIFLVVLLLRGRLTPFMLLEMVQATKMFAITFCGVKKMYSLCWLETNNFFYRFNIEIGIDIHDGSAHFLTMGLPFGEFRVTFSQPVQRSILAAPLVASLCQYRFGYQSR